MQHTERRERFRGFMSGRQCLYPASVFDPLSARMAQELGFEVGMLGGSVASFSVLGAPDLTLISLTELAEQVRRICRASTLPLLVDADHGYGNALNVWRTIEELEGAGVCAITIEDTLLPHAFASDVVRLISMEEGVGKLKAALGARQDPRLFVIARTSVLTQVPLSQSVERAKAYAATGVDGLFIAGVRTRQQLEAFATEVRVPLLLGGASPEVVDRDYLSSVGVRFCLQGHQPFMAAAAATFEALEALRHGMPLTSPLLTAAQLEQLTRAADYGQMQVDFLSDG